MAAWRRVAGTLVLLWAASCATGSGVDVDKDEDGGGCDAAMCNGDCVDTSTSTDHCGGCGFACDPGDVCEAGQCTPTAESCSLPNIVCGTECVNTQESTAHCGGCDSPCDAGASCVNGTCEVVCDVTQVKCDDECIDPLTNADYCGASADCLGMNAGENCPPGDVCVDGACVLDCPTGQIECAGMCVDPLTNSNYCGASGDCMGANAGVMCDVGDICIDGACVLDCPTGQIDCADMCIDPLTNNTYCGASGDCMGGNAGVTCSAVQQCDMGTCQGFAQFIDFDNLTAPTLFADTVAATNEYAGQGIIFSGPSVGQGGAILDVSSFCMTGQSGANGLMFNSGVGYPTDPETLTFTSVVSRVRLDAGSASSGGTLTMTAYDSVGGQLDQASINLTCAVQSIEVQATGIAEVVITGPNVFGLDNIAFDP